MEELEKRIRSQRLTQLYKHMVPYDFMGISKSRLAGIKRLTLLSPPRGAKGRLLDTQSRKAREVVFILFQKKIRLDG